MELKNLNEATACLLQLIVEDRRLVNKNFINVYTEYPDAPHFDNNVFVLYKEGTVKDLIDLERLLKENKYFHSIRQIRIDDVWYEIAIFTLPGEVKDRYNNIVSNGPAGLTNSDYKKIWKLFSEVDTNIDELIFTNNFHEIKEIIPCGDIIEDPVIE